MYQARVEGRSARHRIRGVDYHVTEWGTSQSPLLMFLHGWGDAGSTFQFVVDEFKKDRFVIAPDWRGFGKSTVEAESYWFPDYLADLDAILEIYSADRPVPLVGHSMGANAASLYAGVMPERVAALVNIEGFGLSDSDPGEAPGRYRQWIEAGRSQPAYSSYASLSELAGRITRRSAALSEDRALFVADKWAEARSDGVIHIKADRAHKLPNAVLYRRQEAIACWKNVTAPVLIVTGSDTEFESETASLTFNHSDSAEIAGAGHMVHFDQPAALADSIEGFLKDL